MTREVVTLAEDASIGEALSRFVEGGFRHLPVVRDGVPVGVVSDRDMRRLEGVLAAQVGDPAEDDARLAAPVSALLEMREVVSVRAEASARDVIDAMLREHVSAVLVTDDAGRLAGIVTSVDVLRALRDAL
jgi:acetoin utilization protein AcuB